MKVYGQIDEQAEEIAQSYVQGTGEVLEEVLWDGSPPTETAKQTEAVIEFEIGLQQEIQDSIRDAELDALENPAIQILMEMHGALLTN